MSVGGEPFHRGPPSRYHKDAAKATWTIYDELSSSADKLPDESKPFRGQFVEKFVATTPAPAVNGTVDGDKAAVATQQQHQQQQTDVTTAVASAVSTEWEVRRPAALAVVNQQPAGNKDGKPVFIRSKL